MNDISPTVRAKRKQIYMAVGVITGIFAVAAVGVAMTSSSEPALGVTRKADIQTKSYIAPGEAVDPKEAWRGASDSRLNNLEQKLSSLEAENRILKGQIGTKTGAAPSGKSAEQMSDTELDKRLAEYERSVEKPKDGYPAGTPASPVAGQAAPPPAKPGTARAPGVPAAPQSAAAVQPSGFLTVRVAPSRQADGLKTAAAGQAEQGGAKKTVKTTQNYLPPGMFGQALLLAGLDAPTGGQAQSNPHPVLLQLHDLAKLPNRYRYDWAQCLVTGAGYGDLSSERGYIRTETLSCVSKDGKVLDVPLKGYIVGEDGKAGMRGRLVSKQGQVLGNALLAGVVSGIGTGLERSSSIQSISPLGSTTSIKPGQEFQSGIGSGVGKSLDRLASYYINLAEKMFPVIEVDAGRMVDIVITQGVLVDVDLQDE
ncbi:TrbI/VirB10 family protein [Massilia sp. CCM 8734]|uniref:TrbI/VirB10 family protein n=1 Tax=Massilia sp. CCM 8734 TaxID=2609283 RepID=UPI00141F1BD2|nr:TrbI/VirB10 family protein [Massilia sp. CCM 8734]